MDSGGEYEADEEEEDTDDDDDDTGDDDDEIPDPFFAIANELEHIFMSTFHKQSNPLAQVTNKAHSYDYDTVKPI